ncbi:MAG: amino acid ABC transporter permease [Acidimicrobiales bacterium]
MTVPMLTDALGPRARRKVRIISIIAGAVLVLFVVLAIRRLGDNGQLESDKWEPLTRWSVLKFYLVGLGNTVKAAAVAMVFALTVGGLIALARLARHRLVRWLATGYVEFFRGLPLLLLILFTALGLPQLGVRLEIFTYLVIALGVYNSAVLAEIFRAGILSLDRGQGEAASSLGLAYWPAMAYVILPQAVRRMVPAIVSQLVTLLKDTSLGFIIAFEELLGRARINGIFFTNNLQSLTLAALMFVAINWSLSRLATRLEARQRRRYRAGGIAVTGIEDLAVDQAKAAGPAAL